MDHSPQGPLTHGLGAVDSIQLKDPLLDVRGQKAKFEKLAHQGTGEAQPPRNGGPVVDVPGVDGSLEEAG